MGIRKKQGKEKVQNGANLLKCLQSGNTEKFTVGNSKKGKKKSVMPEVPSQVRIPEQHLFRRMFFSIVPTAFS